MVDIKQIKFGFNIEIHSSSKPTTRPNGSGLVEGDRWVDLSAEGFRWFWNGTYWVSDFIDKMHYANFGTAGRRDYHPLFRDYNYYLLSFNYNALVFTTNNGSNFWNLRFERVNSSNTPTTISSANTSAIGTNTILAGSNTLNLHVDVAATGMTTFGSAIALSGSPSGVQFAMTTFFRYAKP